MQFLPLKPGQDERILEMSEMAAAIVKEHFDPIIGAAQNDYMISLFQTPKAIAQQLEHGYRYYFVKADSTPGTALEESENLGFLAFYPRGGSMYISKFYLYKKHRGKGCSRRMFQFVLEQAASEGLDGIELNVNRHNSACKAYEKLGMYILREEKNDIGSGFYMDDFVYRYDLKGKTAPER